VDQIARLFDGGSRERKGPARFGEPSFPYLNESARPDCAAVRELLETWFANYPAEHRDELRRRFRSVKSRQHDGAFLELYLHALLPRLGFEVDAHPLVPTGQRPDYLIRRGGSPLAFIEATATNESGQDPGEEARKERIHQTLSEIVHPNFMLGVCVEMVPAQDIPRRDLIAPVRRWLYGLDPDAPPGSDPLAPWPRKVLEGDNWRAVVEAIPRRPEKRGTPLDRAVGMVGPYGGMVTPERGIREALRAKAKQFPPLELPLIVAINCLDTHVDDDAIREALFGTEQIVVEQLSDGSQRTRHNRAPDGAWWRGEPVNQRISVALIFQHLYPWTVGITEPVLWQNPWAERPFPEEHWPLATRAPVHATGMMRVVPSRCSVIADLLGLPPDWPGPDE